MATNDLDEFYGAAPPWNANPEDDPAVFHQGGLDGIAPAYDVVHPSVLTGAIGLDPYDAYPSLETRDDVEPELPQWGPPFIKFVDGRISDLEEKVAKATEKWSFQTRTDFFNRSFNTDGAGAITEAERFIIYESVPGFTMALHRLLILVDGSTFGTPFTGAGAYWELRINGEAITGGSMVSGSGSLPFEKTWGTRDAPRIRDGEIATFFMSAGPVSKRITIKGQGSLDRTIEG